MYQRAFLLATLAVLLPSAWCQGADDVAFERPNEDTECGTDPVDFLEYGRALEFTTCGDTECEYQEQAGTLFDIKYREEYKVIEYNSSPESEGTVETSATYILHRCGTEQPDDEFITELVAANTSLVHFVEIPLTAVATGDSTVGWMLEELGLLDRVRFGSTTGTSPCVQKLAASTEDGGCDRPFIVPPYNEDYEVEEEPTDPSQFDAEFGFAADIASKKIYMQASGDPGPLARAEHIIYLSTFFNAEAKAILYYKDVQDSYVEKAEAAIAEDAEAEAPTVAWISAHANGSDSFITKADFTPIGEGPAVTFSFARYKALLTRDAGGDLPTQASVLNATGAFANGDDIHLAASEFGSEAEMLTALQGALEGVDVLIDESFSFTTVGDLLGLMGLNGTDVEPTSYPFIANDDIWRHDKAQSTDGNDDWFGGAVARPDIVHSDLLEIFTPGSLPNHEFRFFRNVAKGEETTVEGLDACTDLTCEAWAEQEAITVSADGSSVDAAAGPEGSEGDDDEDVTEDSAAGSMLLAGAVTAGAIIAAIL